MQVINQQPLVGTISTILRGRGDLSYGKVIGVACDTRQTATWLTVTTK